jgi:hypothetical protein
VAGFRLVRPSRHSACVNFDDVDVEFLLILRQPCITARTPNRAALRRDLSAQGALPEMAPRWTVLHMQRLHRCPHRYQSAGVCEMSVPLPKHLECRTTGSLEHPPVRVIRLACELLLSFANTPFLRTDYPSSACSCQDNNGYADHLASSGHVI